MCCASCGTVCHRPWRAGHFWQLQYHHQVNSFAAPQSSHPAGFDPDSLGYGLPYECCASNAHQGFPRFSQHGVAMRSSRDNGLLLAGYTAGVIKDGARRVTIVGDYPFDDASPIVITVNNTGPSFSLWLRVPSWAHHPTVAVVGRHAATRATQSLTAGVLWMMACSAGTTTLHLSLPMTIRVEKRLRNAVAILRGPLLYALPLNFTSQVISSYYPPLGVNEALYAAQPWRQAVVLSDTTTNHLHTPNARLSSSVSTFDVHSNDTHLQYRHYPKVNPSSVPFGEEGIRGVIVAWVREVHTSAWPATNCTTNFAGYHDTCTGIAPTSPLQSNQMYEA